VEDYITKPFNFSEVLARIKAVLHNRELQEQVILKERKVALSQSLNKSLVYFTRHLREPVLELLNRANDLDKHNSEQVGEFVGKVIQECEQVLATLGGLEEEIAELESKEVYDTDSKQILEDLEKKFQKQFSNWKKQVENLDGVS
jgi:DNA-binding response OmpR family regulator